MITTKTLTLFLTSAGVTLVASLASAVTITSPASNASVGNSITIVGTCSSSGAKVRAQARDSANVYSTTVSVACASSKYSAVVDASALKAGALRLRSSQVVKGRNQTATVYVVKAGANPTPTPTPTPQPTPQPTATVTPAPTATPTPKPTVTPTPTPVTQNILMGVNGHDGLASYPMNTVEGRLQLLNSKNIRSYRTGGDLMNDLASFDTLVALAKKYNITLRPMMYPTTQAKAYAIAKRYANDIKVWEVGNEQDYSRDGAQDRINVMVATYKGIKQASDELGANLKTTINVMACNSDYTGAGATCPGDKKGAMWFTEMAKASGFNFDYVSFHYYPGYGDKGYWMDLYLSQLRGLAVKYNTKVFYNEMNCAEIYQGNTDGGHPGDKGCYDSVQQMINTLNTSYKDVVQEINVYELIDEPNHPVTWEKHFGVMYDINTPKPLLDLISSYAK